MLWHLLLYSMAHASGGEARLLPERPLSGGHRQETGRQHQEDVMASDMA